MIGKIPKPRRDGRSSFKALINYCLGITGHSEGAVLYAGKQNINDFKTAAIEMESLAIESVRCKTPAFHFILSWRSHESPTNEQVDEAVNIALKELNLENCQAVWGLQSDTDNLHVHVAVNRISPETFKAIKPAGGYSKKALEKAARKIEIAQGWEIENTGRYEVNSSGQIFEKKEISKSEISQTARDVEAHTGFESIERIAKREIAPILEQAVSWQELHKNLAEHGFTLKVRGNGAILQSSGTNLKLSSVSRKCSFTQLKHRLGTYIAPDENLVVRNLAPIRILQEPIVNSINLSWKKYQSERNNYFQVKNSALKKLRELQKQERKNLYYRQKENRSELFSKGWRAHGKEFNQLRSILAFVQQKERLNLKENQNDELQELKSHFLKIFPSFRDWLADQNDENLYCLYRYPGQFILSPEQSGINIEKSRKIDLRNYKARRGASGSVLYCREWSFTADFSDMGKRIILNKKKLTEESVAAALQLANQKWGATQINGNAEYKELCVKAAVKYGLKISNPDLAAEVERRRQALRQSQFITIEEISKLNLVENPKIYVNPRKDNQQYTGRIVHVDENRGYCVQLVGQRSLFVHRLEKLERPPLKGETLRISYLDENHRAKIQREEVRKRLQSL
ncbi:MAG: relaxase/mobilization nuclease domain-containing protein [Synergistaceae bacterium]|nr:relaxase/mobilization nuclease domain-containing protein [Synergistaceae bacterium]